MKNSEQYALNSFREAQTFLNENDAKVGILNQSDGRKLLDASVAILMDQGVGQTRSRLEMDGLVSDQKALEYGLWKEHMQPIADFARAKLRGVPNFARLTRSASKLKGRVLIRAARAMAAAAQPHADELTSGGFPADVLAQLGQFASTLEAALDGRAQLKNDRVESTDAIAVAVEHGKEAVKMLTAAVNRQFASDRSFRAAWRSASRIVAKPGVARPKKTTDGTATAPAPTVPVVTK